MGTRGGKFENRLVLSHIIKFILDLGKQINTKFKYFKKLLLVEFLKIKNIKA